MRKYLKEIPVKAYITENSIKNMSHFYIYILEKKLLEIIYEKWRIIHVSNYKMLLHNVAVNMGANYYLLLERFSHQC